MAVRLSPVSPDGQAVEDGWWKMDGGWWKVSRNVSADFNEEEMPEQEDCENGTFVAC
jgi:hypothetical protein